MSPLVVVLLLSAAAAGVWRVWRAGSVRQATHSQLDRALAGAVSVLADLDARPGPTALPRVYPRRFPWLAPAAGLTTTVLVRVAVGWPLLVALAFGLLATVLTYLAEDAYAGARRTRIETQLAEAIDLLVAALRAGAALLSGLDATLRDARPPLRPYLQDVVGRVRLGDDPRDVIGTLADRIPLETFRLFSTALIVHWEVGGGLAATLATVGRTIRDRIELDRRIRAQGVEAHASVAAVLGITYLLAYLMWRSSPDRVEAFVGSELGEVLVALAIGLQAVGLIWMARVSRSGF